MFGICCAAICCAAEPGGAPTFSLPGETTPLHLRVEVAVNGQSPDASWQKFFSRWFEFFDRDADGMLDREEARRLRPLPLPGKKELAFDLAERDRDSGGVSPAEFAAHLRRGGCWAVVGSVDPPAIEDLRLGALLHRQLDANRDGRFSAEELRNISAALQPFDFNDDEYLDLAEFLDNAPPAPEKRSPAGVTVDDGKAAVVLSVNLGGESPQITATPAGPMEPLWQDASARGAGRFRGAGGRWLLVVEPQRILPPVQSAGDFLAAQFEATLGTRACLPLAEIHQDPALNGLTELSAAADNSGDQRLSARELRQYTALVAEAIQAQIWVTLADRGHNLFPALDADADGRLSYLELIHAGRTLASLPAGGELPRQFQITFGAAPVRSWGGMVIPLPAKRKTVAASRNTESAPKWFQVSDRNGDGILSPREFLGPPEVFRRIDKNGDGTISRGEAAASS
jgi:Ca2+-binding EF-hand superfamily protein